MPRMIGLRTTGVRDHILPLPIYSSFEIGTMSSKAGDTFTVLLGLPQPLVQQLKERSLDKTDTAIQENTSDYVRFGTGSYEEWYSKGRTPFALVHAGTGALAALVWFGPKPLGRKSLKYLSDEEQKKELQQKEDVWHTLVYRSYPPFRGVGLMTDFVDFAILQYQAHFPTARLWVGGKASNAASTALAAKLGFVRREDLFDAEKNWQAMVLE